MGRWATELPLTREVIVYCIYGHEVGRATALRLRAAGINARYLHGGIDAWTIAGRPLQNRGEQSSPPRKSPSVTATRLHQFPGPRPIMSTSIPTSIKYTDFVESTAGALQ